MTPTMLICPLDRAFAMPLDTANTTRPTASSSATMGSRMSVRGPRALYWLMTMTVAAGAVAVAMAPSTMQVDTGSFSGPRMKWRPMSTRSTMTVAVNACRMATTVACFPVFRRASMRNSLPMEKAMKPRAVSDTRLMASTKSKLVKPNPGMPSRPRHSGPTRRPATR